MRSENRKYFYKGELKFANEQATKYGCNAFKETAQ